MSPHVTPALTAEEWANKETRQSLAFGEEGAVRLDVWDVYDSKGNHQPIETLIVYGESAFRYPIADRHGTAALALHAQPFGFTREDVENLRKLEHGDRLHRDIRAWAASLVNRISALLPPEDAS